MKIPLLSPRMLHDFIITSKFAVIPDLPLEYDPPGAIKHKRFLFHFDNAKPCRYGIMSKDAASPTEIKWFDVESHFVFHYGNSWDSQNEQGETVVTFFAIVWPYINLSWMHKEHMTNLDETQNFEKFEFNMTTGEHKRTVLITDIHLEFPVLN